MKSATSGKVGLTPQLAALRQFDLVPVNGYKVPVHPNPAEPAMGWQYRYYDPEQIADMTSAQVRAIGIHCERKDLYVVDLDGKAAVDYVKGEGCDPLGPDIGWRIYRVDDKGDTVVFRWKIPFILTPEQQDLLGRTKFSLSLIHANKEKGIKQEAVEFLGHHCQAVVLGVHPDGGGYHWSGHPNQITTLPDNWFQMLLSARAKVAAKKAGNTPAVRTTDSGQERLKWENPKPKCWICGRPATGPKSGDCRCTQRSDGRLEVHCSQGQTYAPPTGLSPGDLIGGHDGQEWAYVTDKSHGLGDGRVCSVFVIHQPKTMNTPVRALNPVAPTLSIKVAPEEKPDLTYSRLFPAELARAMQVRFSDLPYEDHVVAMAYLSGLSGAVQLGTHICGNPITDYTVPPNIYVATVGQSGQKKTPLIQLAIRKPAISLLRKFREINEDRKNSWIDACKYAKEEGLPRPDQPPQISTHVSGYTGEALNSLLSELETSGVGILIARDELSGLLASLNAYRGGSGGDAQQLLEVFDGHASNEIRCSGDRTYQRCHVSVYGNVQPEVLRKLLKGGDPDGRWARFLFVIMKPMTRRLTTQIREEAMDAIKAAEETMASYITGAMRLEPCTYNLDEKAIELFCNYEHNAAKDALEAPSNAHAALLGKKAAKVLRVAGLLHITRRIHEHLDAAALISTATIQTAIDLVEFLDDWTLNFQEIVEDQHQSEINGVLTHLQRRIHQLAQKSKTFVPWKAIREQMKSSERRGVTAEIAKDAMQALVKQGLGQTQRGRRGGVEYRADKDL
ncbi:DUF3987 domain-containing protein [Synechococcus sp. BSF8S]|uniref:DUF3987 domain-containing protein n=1 Tax=Synechococcales TaxID=1890424 RepID=UPI0016257740|nr:MULTISPECIES: DUF3987 domain-containing protein [unclassified Synechococcus]MBC1261445.1 DUF3987 domain-containing protein [Synechococcus sp. BSF8S]MBC1264476.1 DUF3987 domain-containing protein [Synechococcus sp. BSA11S]